MPLLISPSVIAARGGLVGLLLLAVSPLLSADDLYLSEIEEEARRQATTLITSQTAPKSAIATDDPVADRLASGLDATAFERALRVELPGTFVLYQRLDATHQRQVYEAYRRDNRLASISAQVARLSGGGP